MKGAHDPQNTPLNIQGVRHRVDRPTSKFCRIFFLHSRTPGTTKYTYTSRTTLQNHSDKYYSPGLVGQLLEFITKNFKSY